MINTEDLLAKLAKLLPGNLYLEVVKLAEIAEKTIERRETERVRLANRRAVGNIRQRTPTNANVGNGIYKEDTTLRSKKVSKISIPDDFEPDLAYPLSLGWARERAVAEAENFVDYYRASGKKWKDWPAVWRRWCRSPYQDKGRNGNGTRPKSEREEYGEFLHSLRSEGTNQLLAGLISEPETERQGGDGGDVRGGHGQVPIGNRENGGQTNGYSHGSPDLFAKHRVPQRVVGEESRVGAARTAQAIAIPFRRVD